MSSAARFSYILKPLLIGLSLSSLAFSIGCGQSMGGGDVAESVLSATFGRGSAETLVILDWTGGRSRIYPDAEFDGADLAAFPTMDGRTLADNADVFREAVRSRVSEILHQLPAAAIRVTNGESDDETATTVHLTQELRPGGGLDIGEGEYDPCDRESDNGAIVFGEAIRRRGGVYSFDEWVNVFANVSAHEIGHTLGFAHVVRGHQSDSHRPFVAELMLDGHTMDEMRQTQRFLSMQDTCPGEATDAEVLRLAGRIDR